MLDRRVGGIGLGASAAPIGKMIIATLIMAAACAAIMHLPFFPHGGGKLTFATQLGIIMTFGGLIYFAICAALGLDVTRHLRRRAS
jgi:peptidoglycan biosynthesis protein MviN/MurJ (putative lipid II flippase)